MRIIECYIENFGKISKRKYDFKSGINCIRDDNGSGKTTLAAFIKAMLYGMSDTKKLSLDENDRRHYLPWKGGVCGGSMTFEAGGKTYRVERSFYPKASEDKLAVYDTLTGREICGFEDGVGETLFGIDADGFERTVFLSERALTPGSDNKSISAKLSDLVGCDGDIGSMDEAMKRLEDQRRFYQKKGGSGELADTKSKIDEIKRKLDALGETERALEAAREKLSSLSAEIEATRESAKILLKEREEATVRAAEADYEKQYAEKKLSLESLISRRTAVGEIFGSDIPSYTDIDEASYKATEAKNLKQSVSESPSHIEFAKLSAKFDGKINKADVDQLKVSVSALRAINEMENDPRTKKAKKIFAKRIPTEDEIDATDKLLTNKKHKTPIGCIISYILFAVCCIAGIVFDPILTAAGLVGIIVTLITEAVIKNRAKEKRQTELSDFFSSVSGVKVSDENEMAARLKDMRDMLPLMNSVEGSADDGTFTEFAKRIVRMFSEGNEADLLSSAEEIIKEYNRYSELAVAERYIMSERTTRLERAQKLQSESEEFLRRFKTKTAEPFSELRASLTEYDRLTAEIVARRDEMARLESLHAIGEGKQKKAMTDIENIDKKRHENEDRVTALSREYALTERMYTSCCEELEMRDELIMRQNELCEILEKHTDNYETILLTKKYITIAKDNMTVKYLGKTKEGFLKYAEIIGGISGESFEMDTDFSITKQEGATTKSVEAYSRGTRDLFNLAARFALVDSLYEKEKPFIILDDPFTAFDDKKTDAALKLLREFSKERQIIYFTCSKSRSV